MSIQTTADEKIDEAKKHLKKAERLLAEVIYGEVWGDAEYHAKEYRAVLLTVAEAHDMLGRDRT